MSELADHWERFTRRWQLAESPGRPAEEDIRVYERALREWFATAGLRDAPFAVILGVTPEIARMRWPAPGTRVLAVDQSPAMIRAIWPGAALGFQAACAQWTALPLAGASRDIVIGDGSFNNLAGAAYGVLASSVRRILRASGVFVIRFFLRPDRSERVAAIFDDLSRGRVGSFFAFKWRLAMALHGTLGEGVRLGDVWDAWHAAVPHPETLPGSVDWPMERILTIDDYRGSAVRYTFPTLAEARAALRTDFDELACHFPAYELGSLCPTFVLRPKRDA
jgi:SAM-dependent methyltransferase